MSQTSTTRQKHSRATRGRQMQRMRRKRILHTILLTGMLLFVAAAIVICFRFIRDRKSLFVDAFDVSNEFPSSGDYDDSQRESSFAENLCVGEDGITVEGVTLNADQNGALFDLENKSILYSDKIYEKLYPASMTKIMTALLALDSGNLDQIVTISQSAVTLEAGSQVCGFAAGDQVSLNNLINLLLVYSGNDAAAAIAETIGGSEAGFVEMMNEKAKQLGMTGTHFTNPHGLQDEEHYTTAYDIYLMLNEAMKNEQFLNIIQQASYTANYEGSDGTAKTVTLESTDHYLTGEATAPRGITILGGKTGTTSNAGNCLALISQNAYGKPYISIISNAVSKEVLYEQMNSLLNVINS